MTFWNTVLLRRIPLRLRGREEADGEVELPWGWTQRIHLLEEGFSTAFAKRIESLFTLEDDPPPATWEMNRLRDMIEDIAGYFRASNDPETLAMRLGDSFGQLKQDPMLDNGLMLDEMLRSVAGTDRIPVFTSDASAALWYRERNPATVLRKRLRAAMLLRQDQVPVDPSLVRNTVAAPKELDAMCDGMALLVNLFARKRDIKEAILM